MSLMEFFLFIRVELCCLAVLAYIAFSFFSVKRIKTKIHTTFSSIIICSIFNIFFDIITVYTVNNLDIVPSIINHICHILFVGSTAAIVFTTYVYARTLIFPEKNISIWHFIPFILALLCIIFLPIEYRIGYHTNYSSGIAVFSAYICIIFYFIMIINLLVKYHSIIGKKQFIGIITAILSILIVTSIQAIIHESLVSSIGVLLLNLAFFFTVENPDETLIEELEFAKDKADAANRAKSQFLANMSHEIRTPINAMLGMDEMILRESTEEEILEYAGNIKAAGNTLLSLINEILDFSKIEAGKIELQPENYDISSVIIDIVNMMSAKAKEKGIILVLHSDNNLPKGLYGDAIRIKQCVLNLLTNAIKFTDRGNVTFTISHKKIDNSNVTLQISVKDMGIGIKKEELSKIGSPFERTDESKDREGSGLGLSIVKNLLSLMDSYLEVKSEYGKGTEFSFEINQQVTDWTALGDIDESYKNNLAKIVAYEDKIYAPNAKLLFVDDTQMNLDVIKGLLKRTAIQLDTALSGKEALKLVKEKEYDIIFIDHKMPELDGIETLNLMKKMPDNKNKSKPCIVLTANAISGVKQMYLAQGFTDYISKPVNPEKLENMIRNYLPADLVEIKKAEKKEIKKDIIKIEGIDMSMALRNIGSAEMVESTLIQYYKSIDSNAEELQKLLDSNNFKLYETKIHALKSTSLLIGAKTLAKQAEYIENCTIKEDFDSVLKSHPLMLSMYKSYKNKLQAFYDEKTGAKDKNEKDELTKEEIEAFIKKMSTFVENFDSSGMDNLISEINKKRIPDDFSKKYEEICSLVEKIDFEGLNNIFNS
ncbi:MAG: response regulator [Treponema sp.]|nr:response regulator [Treponema sp.]